MTSSIFMDDILHIVRKHLPFVYRCELSLVCKAFQENHKELLRGFERLTLEIANERMDRLGQCIIAYDTLLWMITELTLAGGYGWKPEAFHIMDVLGVRLMRRDIRHIVPTNLNRILYISGTLHVMNWSVLVKRRAILVPDYLRFGNNPGVKMRDEVAFYAKRGFTMIPYGDVTRVYNHLTKARGNTILSMADLIRNGYSLGQFLE